MRQMTPPFYRLFVWEEEGEDEEKNALPYKIGEPVRFNQPLIKPVPLLPRVYSPTKAERFILTLTFLINGNFID